MKPCMRTLLLVFLTLIAGPAWTSDGPAPGTLEVIAELPINPGNLAVVAGRP